MRIALTCTLAVSVSLAALATAQAQKAAAPVAIPAGIPAAAVPAPAAMPAPAAKPAAAPAPAAAAAPAPSGLPPAPKVAAPACANPNALGVSRTVEIDTTGAPGFGFEHFKQYDFLKPNEVVLTFDDGPWLTNTPAVLKALNEECVKAVFFIIGKHATYYPEILKQVAAEGHTVGSHTWSHKDLSKKSVEEATEEIEKGISAIKVSLGDTPAPFFRFPALKHPPEMVAYLGTRNIAMFSTDMDSFDFKFRKPEQIVSTVMAKLKKHGKGIVLMHDFQHGTAQAVPELLKQLKAGGYKVVHMKAKGKLASVQKYDDMVLKELGPAMANAKPIDSVVRTVGE
ncbi:MAG: oligosaccharide deacetylase [Xanthobacteraceae bacterium]|jgi:peptidoglycan/xylan/chitin deacetylase (PgdA/CDA1 family)|nr:oligosaccharide deacetylase [Xanthobacteraceae bacterium]